MLAWLDRARYADARFTPELPMFGMSLFQSVLERLKAETEEVLSDLPEAARRMQPSPGFVASSSRFAGAPRTSVDRAYADLQPEYVPAPDRIDLPMPAHLERLQLSEIIADLALSPDDSALCLANKRRAFAQANHPDRHPEKYKTNATIRMTTANMLIDEALRRLRGH